MLRQIAVVSQVGALQGSDLSLGTAALQRQATRDLALHWRIDSTVDDFANLENIPVGYWPIIIVDKIQRPGLAGYHTDEHGQPFALVEYSDNWTLAASHEMIEMLIDPFGKTLVPGQSVDPANPGRVQYLVEACDPCQDPTNSYTVNGFAVSDFYTPRYFDPQRSAGVQYSANGKISEPREILPGGYITWHNLAEDTWYQATLFGDFQIRNLGQIDMNGRSLRERIDQIGRSDSRPPFAYSESFLNNSRELANQSRKASRARGARIQAQIAALKA